jgi:rod shape determining protein RodA
MWSHHYLLRVDYRSVAILVGLMVASLLVISSATAAHFGDGEDTVFFTPVVISQIKRFLLGIGVYIFCAGADYNKLREWTWIFYLLMLISLVGVFFTDSVARVHRWYKIPILNIGFQPSEYAKLIIVIALSWYLERKKGDQHSLSTVFFAGLIVFIPFVLILKQPDLGSALVLYPVTLVVFYLGGVHEKVGQVMTVVGIVAVTFVLTIFMGVIDHEEFRPVMTRWVKDYQYDRLDPNTHHQKASATAIALGGVAGTGWRKGEYTGGGWLPMPATDSVFPAFGEEFGLIGLLMLILLFYALIYFGYEVTAVAKDHFGRLLSAGVTTYLAIHIIVNIGMMCGCLPITGVPLILITYGGSSIFSSMAALGILQSIYSRRFMF